MAIKPRGTDSAKVIKVIRTMSLKGTGSENDPCRLVAQYWTLSGRLICEEEVKNAWED